MPNTKTQALSTTSSKDNFSNDFIILNNDKTTLNRRADDIALFSTTQDKKYTSHQIWWEAGFFDRFEGI